MRRDLAEPFESRFVAGDADAVAALVAEHSPALQRCTRQFTPDPDEQDDLIQETWARAYEYRSRYRACDPFRNWLLVICRHVCIDHLRLTRREHARLTAFETATRARAIAVSIHGRDHSDDNAVAYDARVERAYDAVVHLPARQRLVTVFRLLLRHSTRETADALHCKEGTVKATLSAALRHMRSEMNNEC